jgi:hypothetical protein
MRLLNSVDLVLHGVRLSAMLHQEPTAFLRQRAQFCDCGE